MDIAKRPLYEIIFRNPPNEDKGYSLRIKDCVIDSGVCIFEGRTENLRTYSESLTSTSDLTIYPGSYGVVRAFPSETAVGKLPAGKFNVHTSKAILSYKYPWDGDPPPPQIQGVDQCLEQSVIFPDVLIVGSGPLGATYARKIIKASNAAKVLMVEMGAQYIRESVVIGEHKKNTVGYQRDIDSFVHVIKGALSTLSVPLKKGSVSNPWPWGIENQSSNFVQRGQNPDQRPEVNLGASAATRVVGGMATHWTCATPRQLKGVERSEIFTDSEWDALYTEAEGYLRTSRNEFEVSLRHQLVKNTLKDRLKGPFLVSGGREILSLPLACKRNENNPSFVTWSAPNTILGDTVKQLQLLSDHQCTKLLFETKDKIGLAVVKNLRLTNGRLYIRAKKYVICGGAVLTPQLLFNSGFRSLPGSLPALGHWMTEQPMAFCQVILHEHLVKQLDGPKYPDWVTEELRERLRAHRSKHPEDPLPFPFNDPEPQITIPVHKDYHWHTQIHRDAFSYGDVAPNMDSRLVVDLRWFGMVEVEASNRVEFSSTIHDQFNMPQPTFYYVLRGPAKERSHRMMEDMIRVALELGRYIPGSEPQFMEPGLALHVCGTTRAGDSVENSVVDKDSKVWGVKNLWLGGNGVIPTKNASNPTLTSMCFAIKGAEKLISELYA